MTIKLRALEEWDLEQLRDWRNDDSLRYFFREYRLLNMLNQRDWFEFISRSREVEMFGIEATLEILTRDVSGGMHHSSRRFSNELVGVCGLCNIDWVNRNAEVSIYVAADLPLYAQDDRDAANHALELLEEKAFNEFNLHRLWAEIYEFHTTKIALFEQRGYVLEGKSRASVFKKGKYHDSLMYGLLKEEQCSTDR